MNEDQKYLELFSALIKHIDKKNGNIEFSTQLINQLHKSVDSQFSELNTQLVSLYTDIKRTKLFLKHIDKNDWLEGLKYYRNIKFPELKIELIKDFKEMKIADRNNEIIEYTRRLVMQLENCANTVIEAVDAHDEIIVNESRYQDDHNNLRKGQYSFFSEGDIPKEIKDIPLRSKLYFVQQFYQFKYYWKPVNEMIKIRNKASHRGEISSQEQEIIDNAKNNVIQKKAEYFTEYNKIIKELKDLYNSE